MSLKEKILQYTSKLYHLSTIFFSFQILLSSKESHLVFITIVIPLISLNNIFKILKISLCKNTSPIQHKFTLS